MPWFKVDDALHSHPKARKAGLSALGLWVVSGSFSASYMTAGFVSEQWVASYPRGKSLAARLVAAKLWEPGVFEGDKGWFFHDWNDFQPSKAEILAERAAAKERQRRSREARRNKDTGQLEEPGHGVTHGVTDGVSHATPSQPSPAQPVPGEKPLLRLTHQSSNYVPAKSVNE